MGLLAQDSLQCMFLADSARYGSNVMGTNLNTGLFSPYRTESGASRSLQQLLEPRALGRQVANFLLFLGFEFAEAAFKEAELPSVFVAEDVGSQAGDEPAVVRDRQDTAREVLQGFLKGGFFFLDLLIVQGFVGAQKRALPLA